MKKKKVKEIVATTNDYNAAPCKHCKRKHITSYPYVSETEGLFYARCPNCNHYDQYEFLGISTTKAIQVWNRAMEARNNY